jgi:hypothetical protein
MKILITDQTIAVASFILNLLSFIILGCIAYLTLKFTAKPKIKVVFVGTENILGSYWFHSDQITNFRFYLENIGRFYAKPATSITTIYLNFDPQFEPISVRYGSTLEKNSKEIYRGKNNCKYFKVNGLQLFHNEPGEEILAEVRLPKEPGMYRCWLAIRAEQCDHGIHAFSIKCL